MILKAFGALLISIFTFASGYSQGVCTTLGQNPATAFPVCGTTTFAQSTVPACGGQSIPVPCNDNAGYSDILPFWYKFTCFTSGTLGFMVTPVDLNDDYDWQLFDVTGKLPQAVYTDPSMFVACNWSAVKGVTGASASGTNLVNCAGTSFPNISAMPTLIQGHEYLLLLSNFDQSQKGYKLSFDGGTANIVDPKEPKLGQALSGCGGATIGIKLNKKMKCASLALNGSDFTISPANASIVSAKGNFCANGFDMDSVILTFSAPLTPGNYTVTVKQGGDLNTLLDACDRAIPVGESLNFTVFPVQPTPMDSLTRITCAPNFLELVFRSPIRCSSIASDGSDFTVTGPVAVGITGATGSCNADGTSRIIRVMLSSPLQVGGLYSINLRTGSDGNTIVDECMQQTPAGATIAFTVSDTVSADFSYQTLLGCTIDTIQLSHDGRNNVNSWIWYSNGTEVSTQQNEELKYTVFGQKIIKLKVSNGVCTDSSTVTINLDNEIKADFDVADIVCPEDVASFLDKSTGSLISWSWDFGNGTSSSSKTPVPQKYNPPTNTRETFYTARLIVRDANNCADTLFKRIKAVNTCIIAVPNAFTPNNDGKNDFLYPLNAYKADNLMFRVYNRFGQVIFETKDWNKRWDGTINGRPQPSGTYVWLLQYVDRDTQKSITKKGTTIIIR